MNAIHDQNSRAYVSRIVVSVAATLVCTTLAALFFTNIIPSNSPIASLTSGSISISLNIFPIIIGSYSIYRLRKMSLKAKDTLRPAPALPTQPEVTTQPVEDTKKATTTPDSQLQGELITAVRNGREDIVKQILDSACTPETMAPLLAPPNLRPILSIAVTANEPSIVQLILEHAARFNLLADSLLYVENGRKFCTIACDMPKTAVPILNFLEAHPVPLRQVLEWSAPYSGRSLFQLAVEEDSKREGSQRAPEAVTAAILKAAKKLDMCMPVVTRLTKNGKTCFDTNAESVAVIRCIMQAVGTPENQLEVVELAKDMDGEIKFVQDESIIEIAKYELLCRIKTNSEIKRIEALLDDKVTVKGLRKAGVLTQARKIAEEHNRQEVIDLLDGLDSK